MPLIAPPPIATPRLLVRLLLDSDLPDLMAVNGDAQVTQFLPYAAWTSMADAQAWLERMTARQATGQALQFVVFHQTERRAIGTCLLFNYDDASARAELGYALGRAHWGQGLMREALVGLLAWAFGDFGLRRIEAEIDPRNRASMRLLQGLGFAHEGVLRQRWVTKGETHDVAALGLLRDEWATATASSALTRQTGQVSSSPG